MSARCTRCFTILGSIQDAVDHECSGDFPIEGQGLSPSSLCLVDLVTGEVLARDGTVAEVRKAAYRNAWTDDEFQEAMLENAAGRPEKLDALLAKRAAIRG